MIYGRDKIEVQSSNGGYVDQNGDWNPGTETWGDPIECDAEPNGAARTIPQPDGKDFRYNYQVTLDVSTPHIPYGTKVRLTCKGAEPQELIVKGFHTYSFQAKLWL